MVEFALAFRMPYSADAKAFAEIDIVCGSSKLSTPENDWLCDVVIALPLPLKLEFRAVLPELNPNSCSFPALITTIDVFDWAEAIAPATKRVIMAAVLNDFKLNMCFAPRFELSISCDFA